MLKSMLLARVNAMLENNMAFYSKKEDPGRKARAKGLQHYLRGVDRKNWNDMPNVERSGNGHAVLKWEVPSGSTAGKSYECYIGIVPDGPSLFALAHGGGNIGRKIQLIKDADVKCFCTCPDFNYSGARYNMKHKYGGYLQGYEDTSNVEDGSDIAPQRKGEHVVCKHLLACFSGILTNAGSIMKMAREARFPAPPEPEPPKVLNQEKEAPAAQGGKVTAVGEPETPETGTGEIQMANGGANEPQVAEEPDNEKIKVIGKEEGQQLPEAQEALDALANVLTEEEAEPASGGPIGIYNADEEESEDNNDGQFKGFNGDGTIHPFSDLEDAAQLKIFNGNFNDDDEENG